MKPCPQRWRKSGVLRELVRQWHAARSGPKAGTFQKPFSRDWENLLEDAGLLSAESRREADRDARELAKAGLLRLKTVPHRPYQIERLGIPFAAEPGWLELFPDEVPAAADAKFDPAGVSWQPELEFLAATRVAVAPGDLLKLNEFFAAGGRAKPPTPIKERSLLIFGDEKRLDALRTTALFRNDRLSLDLLRCFVVPEPLGWRRGARPPGPVLVLENAATWDSYCRWDGERRLFSALVYGCGNRFADSATRLADVLAELGGPRQVLYFGDLDPQGLRIPMQASGTARVHGLPPVEPELWSYRMLLEQGRGKEGPLGEAEPTGPEDLLWLGDLSHAAGELFAAGHRLAQEHIGFEFLAAWAAPGVPAR